MTFWKWQNYVKVKVASNSLRPHGLYSPWTPLGQTTGVGSLSLLQEIFLTQELKLGSPACIGEGNGNPLQCSCLENPRDWGAWWGAIYGVS